MKNKNVFIIIIIGILCIMGCSKEGEIISYTDISIEEMYEIIDNGIIIDVRTSVEYEDYHLEDSINIPLDELESIENMQIAKDAQLFVYCASGVRSQSAAELLIELGYTNVYDMGGISS